MRAIQIQQFGGPEVLTEAEVPEPEWQPGMHLIEVVSAGVNYADTHAADDSYLTPQRLPLVPGAEVVGRVLRGPDAPEGAAAAPGQGRRVVALVASGGYAERALASPGSVFELPDEVGDGEALSLVLQGTTAWHLLRTSTRMAVGESVVVHSAAGGVGSLAVQLAHQWGAGRVIATASSADKRRIATDLGADAAVDVASTSSADEVRDVLLDANGGRPVDVVLEMTGGHVLDGSLAALAPFGRLAVYGNASRTPGRPVSPGELTATSRSVIGFWLMHAVRLPGGMAPAMEELLSLHRAGALCPVVGGHYPLADAARAHEDLLARRTTGKLVLDVTP